jgi:hypothetical protein
MMNDNRVPFDELTYNDRNHEIAWWNQVFFQIVLMINNYVLFLDPPYFFKIPIDLPGCDSYEIISRRSILAT